ncbi:hypothetical protein C8R47DRAFT_1206838 [Mycena vitilis]|nr:hypothetical protein C8R47DRAFT_1206838 [Mycena vitilis]
MALLWDKGDAPYAKAMVCHWNLFGKLLLNPASTNVDSVPARIGDVGYFSKGRFICLFHAVENPLDKRYNYKRGKHYPWNFVPFKYEDDGGIAAFPTRPHSCLTSNGDSARSLAVEANAGVGELKVDLKVHLEASASVYTKSRQYIDGAMSLTSFCDYAATYGQSWLEFARTQNRDAKKPVFITGLIRTRDYETRAVIQSSTAMSGAIGTTLPAVVPVSLTVQGGTKSTHNHDLHFEHTPQTECTWDYDRYIDHRELERIPESKEFTNSIALQYVQLTPLRRVRAWMRVHLKRHLDNVESKDPTATEKKEQPLDHKPSSDPSDDTDADDSDSLRRKQPPPGDKTSSDASNDTDSDDSDGPGGPNAGPTGPNTGHKSGSDPNAGADKPPGTGTDNEPGGSDPGGGNKRHAGGQLGHRTGGPSSAAPSEEMIPASDPESRLQGSLEERPEITIVTGNDVHMYSPQVVASFLEEHDAIGDPLACVAFHIAWVCDQKHIGNSVGGMIPPDVLSELDRLRRELNVAIERNSDSKYNVHNLHLKLLNLFRRAQEQSVFFPRIENQLHERLLDPITILHHNCSLRLRQTQIRGYDINNVKWPDLVRTLLDVQPDIEIKGNFASLDLSARRGDIYSPLRNSMDSEYAALNERVKSLEEMIKHPRRYDLKAWERFVQVLDLAAQVQSSALNWTEKLEDMVLKPEGLWQRALKALTKGKGKLDILGLF